MNHESSRQPFRVVITNAVMSNTGDAAIAYGIIEALKLNGIISDTDEVVIFDYDARTDSRLYPDLQILQQPSLADKSAPRLIRAILPILHLLISLTIPMNWRARAARYLGIQEQVSALTNAQFCISSGGTYLVEHYRIWPRLVEILAATFYPAPVVWWTQSMGPFHRTSSKILLNLCASRSAKIMLRDEESESYIIRAARSARSRTLVLPDVAFALHAKFRSEGIALLGQHSASSVAVSVRDWSQTLYGKPLDQYRYDEAIRNFAADLANSGVVVEFVSTCQGVAQYSSDDSNTALRIAGDIAAVTVDRQFHSPPELMGRLSNHQVVVSTRMHMAILGLLSGATVIAIAYEFKTLRLFESLGLSVWVCRYEDVTPNWLLERFNTAASGGGYASKIESELDLISRRAARWPL